MRILYGVVGEGLGHATRSLPVIKHLEKDHEVEVIASNRAYTFLKSKVKTIHQIKGLKIIYKNNSIHHINTFFSNIFSAHSIIKSNLKIIKKILNNQIDYVITDFDFTSYIIGKILNVPIISLDNIHATTHTKIQYKKKSLIDCVFVNLKTPFCNEYLITSFFKVQSKKKNVKVFPAILRKELFKTKMTENNHILVYQTSQTIKKELIDLFLRFKKINFIIYGFNQELKIKNITFKKTSNEIIKDLSSANGVITNGGHTLISEALYFKKPILSIPVKKHFEQNLNSFYIEKLGYGMCCKEINYKNLERFLKSLELFKTNLKNYPSEDNSKLFNYIDQKLKNHKKSFKS